MSKTRTPDKFDTPVSAQGLAAAISRGRQRRSPSLHATRVSYLPDFQVLLVGFTDASAVALPVANYPEFAALSAEELAQVEIGFGGNALCLESRDLHVAIEGLVTASPDLMHMAATVVAAHNGRRTSETKARAARANGAKGGRPPRTLAETG